MKSTRIPPIAAIAIFLCGAACGVITSNTPTVAQIEAEAPAQPIPAPVAAPQPAAPAAAAPGPIGRYQIAAYATSSNYGCYLLDTTTGDVWHATSGSRMRAVPK